MAEPWLFEVLPCRPAPYPGECCSSYLVRLAEANGGAPVWDLARDLFPRWWGPAQLRLLRWEYPVEDWGRIPLRTQLAGADLLRLTVAPWLAKFRPLPILTGRRGVSPGSFLQGVVHPALQVCPQCVQVRPWVRLLWRLTAVRVCVDHGCLLQSQCPGCDRPLTVIGPSQRLLRCSRCGTDWRTLPVVAASEAELVQQQRCQANLQFLLDPAVTLVTLPAPEREVRGFDLPQAIGLKLRYLRQREELPAAELARQLGVRAQLVNELERGKRPTALPLYLAYLDALSLSWPEFAAVALPPEVLHQLQEPPYLSLRRCPRPGCANHGAPPGMAVTVMADLPDRGIVRFRCTACRGTFTRSHDGALVTKPRRPPLRPGEPPPVAKTAAEIARLTELGLQGLPNRQIAQQLGWGEKTVRMYWISLDLEEQVHAAQARQDMEAVRRHRAALWTRIEAILASLRAAEEEITLRRVALALGQNGDYLQSYPELAADVEMVAAPHNAQLHQRRYQALEARITQAIAAAQHRPEPVTIRWIAAQAGVSCDLLRASYPELHARVRQAAGADLQARQAARRERFAAQINAAAARLAKAGVPLTYTGLLKAAGVDRYYGFGDLLLHTLLQQWIGDPAPPAEHDVFRDYAGLRSIPELDWT